MADDLLEVPGLRGSAVATGVKESGELDLALVVADSPRAAAGVFTRNALPAAPVRLSRSRLARDPRVRAIVINSGNANALTGPRGMDHAQAMARRVEDRCGGPAIVLSTGVIGQPLPIDRVLEGIDTAAGELREAAGDAIAQAILTTDTRPKTASTRVALAEATATIGGMAKGSGMIHPRMATMLAVWATDAELTPQALDLVLRTAVDRSFHEISVDGDTSTNDAVIALAGGAGGDPVDLGDPRLAGIQEGATAVCRQLAEAIVFDGEGASRVLEVQVRGAITDVAARRMARSIARSSLVKTALAGGDPNWGRILAAAANAGQRLDEGDVSLWIADHLVFARGAPIVDHGAADAFRRDRVRVDLEVGAGPGRGRMLTTDLTHRYVEINAEYHT